MAKLQAAHGQLAELTRAGTSSVAQTQRGLNNVLATLEDSLILLRLTHPH